MQLGGLKSQNRTRIVRLVLEKGAISRQEIADNLSISLPTVFQNVTALIEEGLFYESGSYVSTGGRKAKVISISPDWGYSIGIDITGHHVRFVLYDIASKIVDEEYSRFTYQDKTEYYQELGGRLEAFISETKLDKEKLRGVGLSIPGIVNPDFAVLSRSHALHVSNIPLKRFSQAIPYPVCYENDAKNAAYAEIGDEKRDTVYLSLNDTVGGAFYYQGRNYSGDNYKSAEFGHIVIEPEGKLCYCGKKGCADTYISAIALDSQEEGGLEEFFKRLSKNDDVAERKFNSYIGYLAIVVSNLRMTFDCDIILGGNVGGYLAPYLVTLQTKVMSLDLFDEDASFVRTGTYKRESSAVGAAKKAAYAFLIQA